MFPRQIRIAAVVALAAATLPPAPADAAQGTPCVAEYDLAVSPGIQLTPTQGTYATSGENGTLTCSGAVGGHAATGPGTLGVSGTYGTTAEPDDCLGSHGPITFTFTIPTTAGEVHASTTGAYVFGPRYAQAPLSGSVSTPRMSAKFTVTPKKGNCVIEPLTVIHLKFDLVLTD